MGAQGCWGVHGAPLARCNRLKDPQEPKTNLAAKPKKIQQKGKGLGADDDMYEVRRGEKGHRESRRARGDWGKHTHMTTDKGQKKCNLFWS
jgi:hypothetical protein